MRVVLVCMGNICRSPMAEVIVAEQARRMGLEGHFYFASRGIMDWNLGHGADPRAMATVARHGLDLRRHLACQLRAGEVGDWDWFVAMDRWNRRDLLALGAPEDRVLMMRQFEGEGRPPVDVPDPYSGGPDGFDKVYEMIRNSAEGLLRYLESCGGERRPDQSRTA